MRKFIISIPANAALAPLDPYKLNLTDEEKIGMRTMAEGREGYARLISRIATQFPDALSRADVPTDLSELLEYYQNLEGNRLATLKSLETIQEIQLGAAADIMTLVDRYAQNLQISRNNEASLDLAMQEVDGWNSRFANNKTPETPENP